MNSIEYLLSNRWIIKNENRDLYYKIKDESKELRKLFQEKFGYSLHVNNQFIKLDKIPGKAEPWMGITEFKTIEEYQIFCYVLVFLEDMEKEEQFILSSLCEFIQLQIGENDDYWLSFSNRKKFVSVLKYCINQKIIIIDDGNTDSFVNDVNVEVLFENSGLSRYFARNFLVDIFEMKSPEDFMKNDWNEEMEDRGIVRRQRIFRRLLLSCGIYKENEDLNDDFTYIRRYRKRMENEFNQIIPCDLQVYHSSAYLILDESVKIGSLFPKNNALDELVVLYFTQLRKGIKNGDYRCNEEEITRMKKETAYNILKRIIRINIDKLPSTYRQKGIDLLCNEVLSRAEELGFIEQEGNCIIFYPVIAKLVGMFDEEE